MYYGEIKNCDIANGLGVRISLFVSGCRNCCKNCFNEVTWSFTYGNPFTKDTVKDILDLLKPDYIDGLTILGGEPLEPENQKGVLDLIKKVKNTYKDKKTIWIYTGFTYEELTEDESCRAHTDLIPDIFKQLDILVDGRFVEELKDIRLKFRGSSNQRVIDMKQTLQTGKITLLQL